MGILIVGRFGALVGHIREEQVGQLLDVVTLGEPVVTEQITVGPEFLLVVDPDSSRCVAGRGD
jgi:hypothetical protein